MRPLPDSGRLPYAYLTTTGRTSGEPRRIELWFALDDRGRVLFLAGDGRGAHWIRNLEVEPSVLLELAGEAYTGRATILTKGPDDSLARRMLAAKYEGWRDGAPMSDWALGSLAVMVDFEPG